MSPVAPFPRPETVLEEAQRITHGDRRASYGHPFDDFARTGRIWGAILNVPDIPPETVGLMLEGLKVSREAFQPKRDTRVDGAGYWNTIDMVHAERLRRAGP